jgi:prophage antirepressor-like protein
MNELSVFKNEEFGEIRTVIIENEPMFCLSDVCKALGLTQPSKVKERLNEKGVSSIPTLTAGGEQKLLYINESNLYKTIFQSRKESAERFTGWVTSEVLPCIRKNGIYATDNVIDNILNNPDFGIELLTKLKEERAARIEAEKTNAILMHVNKTYTMTEIAKEIGLKSSNELNKILAEKKIQYKSNGTWVMYSDYSDLGYESIKQETLDSGRVIYHRRITQLGRKFILGLFDMAA